MVSVRSLSAGLLFFLFAWNLYLGIITKPDHSFLIYIGFCIAFFALAALLLSKFKFAEFIVFILSLAVLIIYPIIVDFINLTPFLSGIMAGIVVIILICSLLLVMLRL